MPLSQYGVVVVHRRCNVTSLSCSSPRVPASRSVNFIVLGNRCVVSYTGFMSEANETVNLSVPEHLEYSDEHVWVDASSSPAVIGITEYAAGQLGDLVYLDMPEADSHVQAGDEIMELESSKAVSPLVSPVSGTIRYVNREAADDPSIVNGDPYGEGWLLKIELDDDEPELLSAEEYAKIAQ